MTGSARRRAVWSRTAWAAIIITTTSVGVVRHIWVDRKHESCCKNIARVEYDGREGMSRCRLIQFENEPRLMMPMFGLEHVIYTPNKHHGGGDATSDSLDFSRRQSEPAILNRVFTGEDSSSSGYSSLLFGIVASFPRIGSCFRGPIYTEKSSLDEGEFSRCFAYVFGMKSESDGRSLFINVQRRSNLSSWEIEPRSLIGLHCVQLAANSAQLGIPDYSQSAGKHSDEEANLSLGTCHQAGRHVT
jgi:hypothetical protein